MNNCFVLALVTVGEPRPHGRDLLSLVHTIEAQEQRESFLVSIPHGFWTAVSSIAIFAQAGTPACRHESYMGGKNRVSPSFARAKCGEVGSDLGGNKGVDQLERSGGPESPTAERHRPEP